MNDGKTVTATAHYETYKHNQDIQQSIIKP